MISVKETFVTVGRIAKELDMKENAVSNKIKTIFNKYGFKEEEKEMYMSMSGNGGNGIYIFKNIDAVKKLFSIYDENRFITAEERDNLIKYLIECLPTFRDAADCKKLFDTCSGRLEFDELYLRLNNSDKNKSNVVGIITKYYIDQVMTDWDFFKERIFVSVDSVQTKRKVRAKIYKYQYELILEWSEKWSNIMNTVNRIRNTEKFDNEYKGGKYKKNRRESLAVDGMLDDYLKEESWMAIDDLYEYILFECEKKLLEKHKGTGSEKRGDEENKINKQECYEKSFEEVKKILRHSLNKDFPDDFRYLIKEAFEELETIRKNVLEREKREYYCTLNEKGNIEDFDELCKVRTAIAGKTRLITDYK